VFSLEEYLPKYRCRYESERKLYAGKGCMESWLWI